MSGFFIGSEYGYGACGQSSGYDDAGWQAASIVQPMWLPELRGGPPPIIQEGFPHELPQEMSRNAMKRANKEKVKPGDWYCDIDGCNTLNFQKRSDCFKCKKDREEGVTTIAKLAENDWVCYRQGCR